MLRITAALTAALLFGSCGKAPEAGTESAAVPTITTVLSEEPVDFEWKAENGSPVRFSSFRGKLTLINFWATWCLPCKEEMPDLVALSSEFSDKGVVFLGISTDRFDAESLVGEFIQKHSIPYTVVISTEDVEQAFGNVTFMPTTFLIDADGKVVKTMVGLQTKAQFKKAIEEHLL